MKVFVAHTVPLSLQNYFLEFFSRFVVLLRVAHQKKASICLPETWRDARNVSKLFHPTHALVMSFWHRHRRSFTIWDFREIQWCLHNSHKVLSKPWTTETKFQKSFFLDSAEENCTNRNASNSKEMLSKNVRIMHVHKNTVDICDIRQRNFYQMLIVQIGAKISCRPAHKEKWPSCTLVCV